MAGLQRRDESRRNSAKRLDARLAPLAVVLGVWDPGGSAFGYTERLLPISLAGEARAVSLDDFRKLSPSY